MKFYSGKHCWIATDVPTPFDYIPNPALPPVQEIIISSLWFPSVITNMSNDDIMKDSAGFAHLELGHLGSASPGLSPIYDLTDICKVRDRDSQNNFP